MKNSYVSDNDDDNIYNSNNNNNKMIRIITAGVVRDSYQLVL